MTKKYVYLIHAINDNKYKIGVSINPQKRLKELKTGNSSELKLVETYLTEIPYKIEKVLHNNFSHIKESGEWFNMSISEEITFVELCKKVEDNLIFLEKNVDSLTI